MGSFWSRLRYWFSERQLNMVCIGLDGAGKTTIVYRMCEDPQVMTLPTVGFNVEKFKTHGVTLQTWDLGGQHTFRQYWVNYMTSMDAVVFVVDAKDRARFMESKHALYHILEHDSMAHRSIPVLIFLNKTDTPGAATPTMLKTLFEVREIERRRACAVFSSVATTGQGLQDGFQWLVSVI